MMANVECGDNEEGTDCIPPFSLHGGLLSTLRKNDSQRNVGGESVGGFETKAPTSLEDSDHSVKETCENETASRTNLKSENENHGGDTTVDAAILLTSVAEIARHELPSVPFVPSLDSSGPDLDSDDARRLPTRQESLSSTSDISIGRRFARFCSLVESNYRHDVEGMEPENSDNNNSRVRAVSITSDIGAANTSVPFSCEELSCCSFDAASGCCYPQQQIMTPPQSPHCAPRRPRSISSSSVDSPSISSPVSPGSALSKRPIQPSTNLTDRPIKKILRKKFSWKNYPELEAFLIANREEYLRHSTLNYTVQQKQYNNCLTERMIELAAEHGYVFDESDFSFVTVRDRIRCYYKSYVQSLKKKGVIIGYAARKAGMVTDDDLEKSAATAGKIYIPTTPSP